MDRSSAGPAEDGGCAPLTAELAAAEEIDRSYICRVLPLTLLAPAMVEAIVDGRQAAGMTLLGLMKGFPAEWERQRAWRSS